MLFHPSSHLRHAHIFQLFFEYAAANQGSDRYTVFQPPTESSSTTTTLASPRNAKYISATPERRRSYLVRHGEECSAAADDADLATKSRRLMIATDVVDAAAVPAASVEVEVGGRLKAATMAPPARTTVPKRRVAAVGRIIVLLLRGLCPAIVARRWRSADAADVDER